MAAITPRGFAAMDPKRQRKIAKKGGRLSGGQFGKPGGADPAEPAAKAAKPEAGVALNG